eukprot:1274955-Rhodomonas_salina.1
MDLQVDGPLSALCADTPIGLSNAFSDRKPRKKVLTYDHSARAQVALLSVVTPRRFCRGIIRHISTGNRVAHA